MISRKAGISSIKNRLTFLFVSITAGAILVIYFYVVPQLQSNLTSQKLDGLERDATAYSRSFERLIGSDVPRPKLDLLTRRLGEQTDAGVTLLGIPINDLDPSDLSGLQP